MSVKRPINPTVFAGTAAITTAAGATIGALRERKKAKADDRTPSYGKAAAKGGSIGLAVGAGVATFAYKFPLGTKEDANTASDLIKKGLKKVGINISNAPGPSAGTSATDPAGIIAEATGPSRRQRGDTPFPARDRFPTDGPPPGNGSPPASPATDRGAPWGPHSTGEDPPWTLGSAPSALPRDGYPSARQVALEAFLARVPSPKRITEDNIGSLAEELSTLLRETHNLGTREDVIAAFTAQLPSDRRSEVSDALTKLFFDYSPKSLQRALRSLV